MSDTYLVRGVMEAPDKAFPLSEARRLKELDDEIAPVWDEYAKVSQMHEEIKAPLEAPRWMFKLALWIKGGDEDHVRECEKVARKAKEVIGDRLAELRQEREKELMKLGIDKPVLYP